MYFTIGQKIIHPEYGEAIVRFVGKERVGLEFPDGQQALFKKDDLNKSPLDYDIAAAEGKTDLPWPQSTFIPDGEEEEHYPGAHWQPFVDDTGEILAKLPEYLKSAREKNALGLLLKPERALPEDWTKGFALAWPSVQEGLAIGIRIAAGAHEIVSVFPFTRGGSQHQLTVKKVRVWEDGLTAQIDALFGNAVLTFFDTDFVANRGWYEAGRSQEFLLTGLAYSARPAEIFEISITHSPDEIAWFNQLPKTEGRELMPEETLSLRGWGFSCRSMMAIGMNTVFAERFCRLTHSPIFSGRTVGAYVCEFCAIRRMIWISKSVSLKESGKGHSHRGLVTISRALSGCRGFCGARNQRTMTTADYGLGELSFWQGGSVVDNPL